MTGSDLLPVLLVAAVLVGSAAQRLTGVGFALIVAPFAVLSQGPQGGVVVVCLVGVSGATVVLFGLRRDVDLVMLGRLVPPAVVGVVGGAVLLAVLPEGPAQVASGVVVVVGVLAAAIARRLRPVAPTRRVLWLAGTTSGVMSGLAGLAGPALAAFALVTRWPHDRFVAAVQPYFVVVGTGTLTVTLVADPNAWPSLSGVLWAALAGAVLVGAALGGWVRSRLPTAFAPVAVLVVSLAGGIGAIVDGVFGGGS